MNCVTLYFVQRLSIGYDCFDHLQELENLSFAKDCDSAVGVASLSFDQRADTTYFNKKECIGTRFIKICKYFINNGSICVKKFTF